MVASTCDSDHDLRFLLDLDGLTYHMTAGYWVKFNVWLIEPCKEIPHGIKYSLTLPDKNNVRIVGYDNSPRQLSEARQVPGQKSDMGSCP